MLILIMLNNDQILWLGVPGCGKTKLCQLEAFCLPSGDHADRPWNHHTTLCMAFKTILFSSIVFLCI
jgi:MoxR-like ATPase